MNRTRKLSLLLAVAMLLQLGLPGWSAPKIAEAAIGGPVAQSFYPADNLTSVPLGTDLRILFDENVKLGASTASIDIYRSTDNVLVESIGMGSGKVTISGQREAIINPALSLTSNKFALNTEYYVLVDAGAFLNVSNNAPYAGIQSATRWNFRTVEAEDAIRPTLARPNSYSPSGPGPYSITSPITIEFSEDVYASSGYITLESTDDTRHIPVTSSSLTGSGSEWITITPEGALLPLTTYTVRITGSNFEDASGNAFNGVSWTFTTAAAPVNLASGSPFYPADNANLVPIESDLRIVFDQDVQANGGKLVEIRRVSDNVAVYSEQANHATIIVNNATDTVTINPSANLTANTAYYVYIEPGAFSQLNNASQWFYGITAATIWNFTTGYGDDNSPPSVTGHSPARYGTSANANTNLVLTFNEPVYPYSGNIEIRQSVGNGLFRSIPITSARVTGGGTTQLTINATGRISSSDPEKPFLSNTKYYVTMGNRAIHDGKGNFFTGLTGTSDWEFTITQDGVRPMLVSVSPASGSTAVDVTTSTEFIATFDKPVMKGTDPTKRILINPTTSFGSGAVGTYTVDPTNSRRIIIKPDTTLTRDANYHITIDEGAITDLVGNAFIGIQNQYQWSFLTKGGDTTAPTVSKSEVSGSIIRLIYNEPLNSALTPSPASYYVTVAGAPRNVTSVKVEGNMVLLTLSGSVGYNQKVELSYTRPSTGLVQDLTGNEAASLSKIEISNGFTSTNPVVSSGSSSGNTVVLNFSESLMSPSAYAYTQFTVQVGGTNYNTTAIWHSGSTIQLSLSGTIPSGQSVRVTYSPSSYPLYGTSGNAVSAFSSYSVTSGSGGTGDIGAPNVQYITAVGSVVTIKYNETLIPTSTPNAYQYSITADGQTRAVSGVTLSGDTVILTLNSSVSSGQSILVSYVSVPNTLMDYSGNAAASFTQISANSGTGTGGSLALQSTVVKGTALTLTYNSPLNTTYVPTASSYLVRVQGSIRLVTNVQVVGSTVVLTLNPIVNVGEQVDVTYLNATDGIRSASGQLATTFTSMTALNQTTVLDGLTGDFESAEGGVGIKTTGATMSSDTTSTGTAVNRYTVKSDKFLAAVSTARGAGLKEPRIVFTVPEAERAATVAIPVIALESAAKQGNAIFAVKHGDATYELPLTAVNYSELSRALGGSAITNHVLISMERGSTSKTSALTTMLVSSRATLVAGPIHYEVNVVNGTNRQEIKNYGEYVSRTISTSASIDPRETAVVWLDPVTNTLSYVPTTFKTVNGVTTATFQRKGNSAYALVKGGSSFTDTASHWANAIVQMMARKYIVEGRTASQYEPDKSITRGEFASYIAKGLGLTGNRAEAAKFKDVNANTAMGAYIGAAASAGIVNGVDSSNFKPNSYITRQDMATMMMRAWAFAGRSISLPSSQDSYLASFTDRGKIGSYAKTSMAQAIYLGIINGKTASTLSPTTNASRAEGAVMIMRLLEKAELLSQ
ncbi:Ig-like domain-containing protein [Paenibacillus soyae]|uniref:Ig-like domain-containing protein n=1 Tax=Paenibacillus soyae TaxID=2969249 RepID=A0A9X2SB78_9BACL|nr:Ig-like domain-containing protein [Paenibacillus soyae]MCR2806750.1 Ig-like domain-containing protein [Paenibacillus soyae]